MDEKSDFDVHRTRDDLEMMRRRHLWPGVILHLKKRRARGFPEFAILIYRQNTYRFTPREEGGFAEEKSRTGGDGLLVALVAEGWLVD